MAQFFVGVFVGMTIALASIAWLTRSSLKDEYDKEHGDE